MSTVGARMSLSRRTLLAAVTTAAALLPGVSSLAAQEWDQSLPSWTDGPAKRATLGFIHATTDQSSKDFVRPEDRITTFDQDGTLWFEHPAYAQAMFALDRVHKLASQHPRWRTKEPFKSVLADDGTAIAEPGQCSCDQSGRRRKLAPGGSPNNFL